MTLKQKALAHYDRMIAWAEKQPKRAKVDEEYMYSCINEGWHSKGCGYCAQHMMRSQCPLSAYWMDCGNHCCNGLWNDMADANTWGTWVKRARNVREYIEQHG